MANYVCMHVIRNAQQCLILGYTGFQAKVSAIRAAVKIIVWTKMFTSGKLPYFLIGKRLSGQTSQMANRYDVCITWIIGHKDILCNCRVDELAKRGTTIELSNEFSLYWNPFGYLQAYNRQCNRSPCQQQFRTRTERRKKFGQGCISGTWLVCLNSKEVVSALLSWLLRGIVLWESK